MSGPDILENDQSEHNSDQKKQNGEHDVGSKEDTDEGRDLHRFPPLRIVWGEVNDKNVGQLRRLNTAIFPIRYDSDFYKQAVAAPPGFVKLAYYNELLVGAVCCRKEAYAPPSTSESTISAQQPEQQSEPQLEAQPEKQPEHQPQEQSEHKPPQKTPQKSHQKSQQKSQQKARKASQKDSPKPTNASLYILTLGVLAPYRERGIGGQLVKHVLDFAETSSYCKNVVDVYLHLQDGNDDALRFYHRYGFEVTDKLGGYYKRLEPPDCLVVRKTIREPIDPTNPT